jgi:hypothetical protein
MVPARILCFLWLVLCLRPHGRGRRKFPPHFADHNGSNGKLSLFPGKFSLNFRYSR